MKKIQVIGPGCLNCQRLEERTKQAVGELSLNCEIEKISDINQIIALGVLRTPALAVDGTVTVSGRVPDVAELKELLKNL